MKRLLMTAAMALTVLLTGCASTIRSDVTTFHEWPADIKDKTYALDAPAPQDDTLEARSYQNLVRTELARLGFQEAAAGTQPSLKVSMRFTTTDVQVRRLEPDFHSQHFFMSSRFGSPFYRPYWGGRRYWAGGWYSPFYDPFWYGPTTYTEVIRHYYKRDVRVAIRNAADGKPLFDVTVNNTSREMSTPAMMPALVHSAFAEFPGPSGVARRVELKKEG